MANAQPLVTGEELLNRIKNDVDTESLARADQIRVAVRVFQEVEDSA